ncbi:beta-class phenol-soluble modulin [Corynebacterium pyruviciproducens]|nr:beta-class phenol-soluble modulin [Corynebacterium pyruviciproducens]MDK7214261.1 beta-class phenol-soluble modulin [Corynebacterium pyruviciproducens]
MEEAITNIVEGAVKEDWSLMTDGILGTILKALGLISEDDGALSSLLRSK